VVSDGLTEDAAAQRMGVPVARLQQLLAQQRDRDELKALRQNWVETAAVRAFIEQTLGPEVKRAELAHWLNMEQSDLDRQLGYAPGKNGKVQQRLQISTASRVVIALGRAPHELDGC